MSINQSSKTKIENQYIINNCIFFFDQCQIVVTTCNQQYAVISSELLQYLLLKYIKQKEPFLANELQKITVVIREMNERN